MNAEIKRQLNFLASMPNGHTTMTREDVREILLQTGGVMLACGRLYDIEAKSLGAGVYRVSLRPSNP